MQTENMDSSLYAYSLSLSAQLDAKFGKDKKTGASQKDVPGATRGIVPIMHKAGISFFHVGANDARYAYYLHCTTRCDILFANECMYTVLHQQFRM